MYSSTSVGSPRGNQRSALQRPRWRNCLRETCCCSRQFSSIAGSVENQERAGAEMMGIETGQLREFRSQFGEDLISKIACGGLGELRSRFCFNGASPQQFRRTIGQASGRSIDKDFKLSERFGRRWIGDALRIGVSCSEGKEAGQGRGRQSPRVSVAVDAIGFLDLASCSSLDQVGLEK